MICLNFLDSYRNIIENHDREIYNLEKDLNQDGEITHGKYIELCKLESDTKFSLLKKLFGEIKSFTSTFYNTCGYHGFINFDLIEKRMMECKNIKKKINFISLINCRDEILYDLKKNPILKSTKRELLNKKKFKVFLFEVQNILVANKKIDLQEFVTEISMIIEEYLLTKFIKLGKELNNILSTVKELGKMKYGIKEINDEINQILVRQKWLLIKKNFNLKDIELINNLYERATKIIDHLSLYFDVKNSKIFNELRSIDLLQEIIISKKNTYFNNLDGEECEC